MVWNLGRKRPAVRAFVLKVPVHAFSHAYFRAEDLTADNSELVLCVCMSYGGRQDILHAAQQLCKDVQEGKLTPEQVRR